MRTSFGVILHYQSSDGVRLSTFPENDRQDWITLRIGDLAVAIKDIDFMGFERAMERDLQEAHSFFLERRTAREAVAAYRADLEANAACELEGTLEPVLS